MPFSRTIAITLIACCVCIPCAFADRIGVLGKTYPITEQNFLDYIYDRLKAMQAAGDFEKIQEKLKKQMIKAATEPKAVEGLSKTINSRTFYYDPGIKIEQDIKDQEGHMIAPSGTYMNPLDVVSLRKRLFFFDGNDPNQRAKAKQFYEAERSKPKLILVAGKPMELMDQWDVRVFFDQSGLLTKRLGIEHIPAIVSQEGRLLRIDEIKTN